MRRFIPGLIGTAFGLVFGLTYWFAWGCTQCAKDQSPVTVVLFCTVVGTILGHVWGKDHVQALPPTD